MLRDQWMFDTLFQSKENGEGILVIDEQSGN